MTKCGLCIFLGAWLTTGQLGCGSGNGGVGSAGTGGSKGGVTTTGGSFASGAGGATPPGTGGAADSSSAGTGGMPAGSGGAPNNGSAGGGGSSGSGSGGRGASGGGAVATAGNGGMSATAGGSGAAGTNGGNGGMGDTGDTPPWRPLNVTGAKMRLSHTFRAKDADPAVSFNDNTEVAAVDPRSAKMVGKLVLPFGGLGSTAGTLGNEGPFVLPRGFHVLGIAAYEDYTILQCDADFFSDARRQVFDGVQHTTKYGFATVKMVPSDGVAKRTEMALKYLAKMYPTEDWGYFLNQDGTVRWSDVIFTGISHGASNAPRFAMLVRASRSVAFAGPRDNSSGAAPGTDAYCPTLVTATWLTEKPLTPIDRFYTLSGSADAQHPQHLFAMEKLGYVGQPVDMSVGPPYNNSHRITGPGGHESPCNETNYKVLCNYLFGVDPANVDGVP